MSVIVKGMEMPTEGTVIAIYKLNGKFYASVHGTDLCPIVEVPPHGDLIDREELQHIIGQFSLNWEYGQGVSDCWDALLDAPTVIEAEE